MRIASEALHYRKVIGYMSAIGANCICYNYYTRTSFKLFMGSLSTFHYNFSWNPLGQPALFTREHSGMAHSDCLPLSLTTHLQLAHISAHRAPQFLLSEHSAVVTNQLSCN